jgi:hypothetical protein
VGLSLKNLVANSAQFLASKPCHNAFWLICQLVLGLAFFNHMRITCRLQVLLT